MALANTGVSQGSILDHTLFLSYINGVPDNLICNVALYVTGIPFQHWGT